MSISALEFNFSQAQVALAYGVDADTVRRWTDQGRFGPLQEDEARALNLGRLKKVGRLVMIPASRLRYFEENHSVESPSLRGIAGRTDAELERRAA